MQAAPATIAALRWGINRRETPMSVHLTLGQQLFADYEKKKVIVALLSEQLIKGTLFTAQTDYLQVDEAETGARVTVPFSAVASVRAW
jgi:hypothetical protein